MESLERTKNLVFVAAKMHLLFFLNLQKRVFEVQGEWHCPPLATMVHGQAFGF